MENLWRNSHSKVLVKFIVYVPTNSGLVFVREQGLRRIENQGYGGIRFLEKRGEDIPEVVSWLNDYDRVIIGITGQDLLENFIYSNRFAKHDLILEKLGLWRKGNYADSIFGLPTLCVISRNGVKPKNYNSPQLNYVPGYGREKTPDFSRKRIVIPRRYEGIIRHLLRFKYYLPVSGFVPEEPCEFILEDRKVDVRLPDDPSIDYAIDIVKSGKTVERLGLGIESALFMSDGVLIGNKLAKDAWKPKESTLTLSPFLYWLNTGRVPRQYYGERFPGIH